jgi:hypothetical protein
MIKHTTVATGALVMNGWKTIEDEQIFCDCLASEMQPRLLLLSHYVYMRKQL